MKCFARYHGTIGAYTRAGCRCTDTVEMMRAIWRVRNHRQRDARPKKPPREHGQITRARERKETALTYFTAGRSVAGTAKLMGMSTKQVRRYWHELIEEGRLDPPQLG